MEKNKEQKGLLVAIYGINNIGKSTQVKLLKEEFEKQGKKAIIIKYPVYNLAPTGPQINAYLRQGNPEKLSSKQIQFLFAQNRKDYESKLKELIIENDIVILEDYTGTGISWGMGAGVDKDYLIDINKDLIIPDISILMDGERFLQGEEKYHLHENNYELIDKVREALLGLSKQFNWKIVNANQSIEFVKKDIMSYF
jgi:thymidylate kinase